MNISKDLDVFHDNMSSFSGVSSISQITNKDNCDEANQEEREEDLQFFHCFQRSLVPSDFKIKPKILTQIKAPIKTKQRKITLALSPRNKNNENKMNVIKSRTYATTIKKSETMKKPLSTKTKTPFLDTIKFNLAKTIQNKPYPHKTQSKEIFKVNTTTVNTLVKSSSTMNFLSHKKRTPSYSVNPKYIKEKLENKISEAQSKYMRSLDELYKTKLLKVNEVHKKYDIELLRLKDYIDEDNKDNINNLIYDGVLSDMNTELKEIEDEFNLNKEKAFNLYKQTNEAIRTYALKDIEKTITDLFLQISLQVKNDK